MGSDWPGNVRELENWLERAWLSSPTDQIEVPATQAYTEQHTHSLANVSASPLAAPLASGESLKEYLERLERDALQTLCETLPSSFAIAKGLGISQSSGARLQRYGIKIIR